MLPKPVDGYVGRASLAMRCDPTRRRLTAIHAPGGFGKTTLLGEACRRIRQRGDLVAWLTMDPEDDPKTLAAYLSLAFSEAGLDIRGARATSRDFEHGDYRINLLIHSIEAHRSPCVLALDDVHRLRDPESRGLINCLLRSGPPNLHVALAFREWPAGLEVAMPLLEGRGDTITVEQLRFQKPEIARFFDTRLSPRELNELTLASWGWPIALCMHRNAGKRHDAAMPELAANWIEASLCRGLSRDDRDFVLDVGLFEWIDADVIGEVLSAGAMRRIRTMPALRGLLQSVGATANVVRLHPLVRQCCAEIRSRETPERYRAIHAAIARTIARSGKVVAALRHALEADDPRLIGEIAEEAGGFRIWLLEGLARLKSVEGMLTDRVVDLFPRLGLLRCIALVVAGKLDATRDAYAELHARTDGFSRDRDGGSDADLGVDDVAYRYLMASCGCRPITDPEMTAIRSSVREFAGNRDLDPFVQGGAKHAFGEIELARANLDAARDWLCRARAELVRESRYMTMHVDWRLGMLAMLAGRPADAAQAYARAQRTAKGGFLREAGPTVITDVLATELDLERGRAGSPRRRSHTSPELLAESGAWLDVYAAAAETAIHFASEEGGPANALRKLDIMIEFADRTERTTLTRCLVAFRVSLLVARGGIDEARDLWAGAGLPERAEAIVDLDNQTWREMEAVACARLRLLTALSEFDAARETADALLAVCAERGLKRTWMRGLALAMVIGHRAGNPVEARARLVDYLELFADTDYAIPLVSERETGLAILNGLYATGIAARLHREAAALSVVLQDRPGGDRAAVPTLTVRELEVLQRLERWPDKEIGAALDLSVGGVRYHVNNLFRKLGVRSRFDAIRRARALGILPAPSSPSLHFTSPPPPPPPPPQKFERGKRAMTVGEGISV